MRPCGHAGHRGALPSCMLIHDSISSTQNTRHSCQSNISCMLDRYHSSSCATERVRRKCQWWKANILKYECFEPLRCHASFSGMGLRPTSAREFLLLRVQLPEHQKLMRAHILVQGLGDGAHSIFYDRDLANRKCSRIRLAKLVRIQSFSCSTVAIPYIVPRSTFGYH